MTKIWTISLLAACIIGSITASQAQAVMFRLEIPAGVSFEGRVLHSEPKEGFPPILWVEMVAQENIEMLVTLRDEKGNFSTQAFYLLTDGSGNFANAREINRGIANTTMIDQGILVWNVRPKVTHLRSWLGIPATKGSITTIEYF